MTSSGRPGITPALAQWMASYVASLLEIATRIARVGVQNGPGGVFSPEFLAQLERAHAAARAASERVGRPLTVVCPRCGDALGFTARDSERETLQGWCSTCAVVFEITFSGRVTDTVLDVQAWERRVTGPRGSSPESFEPKGQEAK